LVQTGARWYDPNTCRFITRDPSGDGVNWYAYCGNNPVTRVDADGSAWYNNFNDYNNAVGEWGKKVPILGPEAEDAGKCTGEADSGHYSPTKAAAKKWLLVADIAGTGVTSVEVGSAIATKGLIGAAKGAVEHSVEIAKSVVKACKSAPEAGRAVLSIGSKLLKSRDGFVPLGKDVEEAGKARGDLVQVSKNLLKKAGLNGHAIKKEVLGAKAEVKMYDLYYYKGDPARQLHVFTKVGRKYVGAADYFHRGH
jgi:hypothetical protein